MKKLLIAFLFAPLLAIASTSVHLDKWPGSVSDTAALQNGAKLFVNYCLNCHGASYMRYKNLTALGLTEQQVKDNLMFTSDKIGGLMAVAARADEQKVWFGATPPDLTIIARARGDLGAPYAGSDWLYTYLRSFYRDDNRPTGWNNVAFENVGMPHVLYGLQGQQVLNHETHKLELAVPGQMSPTEYDKAVSDLVSFMVWMGEPQQEFRKTLGYFVLAFLAVLFVVAYALKKEYWKDIH
ncbi:MAG: cytochrome c1 [Azonexus sp.]|nr:cytochrome c1 [Betaproteobacteria bacterium]MBK8917129.1 cytochrome c1 [Betaproteobacteria bacterium]MBP6035526.1 cytochrome c1 [Azonexus sp.]MBP6906240.1 cytochrome c1 [Azonexus sp.]